MGRGDQKEDKVVIGKEAAVTCLAEKDGVWYLLSGSVALFFPYLSQIMKWPCFVSFRHGLRVTLSENGIL